MDNLEPYEVFKAKADVFNLLDEELLFGVSIEFSDKLSDKIIDMLLANGMIIPEDYR